MRTHCFRSSIRPGTLAAHKARWYVYSYYGMGYDVKCSCGWESRTGGATRTSVHDALWTHRWDEQNAADDGLPNSDPSTWPEDVLRDYLARHQAELRADADAEHELESRVS